MATENTTATAEGVSKIVYGKQRDLRPDKVTLQEDISFEKRNKLGEKFSETIWLADEAGLTYGGSSTDLLTLNEAIAGESKKVEASGCEIVLRSKVSMKRLTTAMEQGKAAYQSFYARLLQNMKNAVGKRVDLSLMHGSDDIGVISSVSGSGTTRAWTITDASWIPLAWLGSKNATIDAYDTTLATKRNTNADVVVTSVVPTPGAYVVNVSGNSTDLTAIVATDRLFFKGAKDNECDGLTKIAGLEAGESYLGLAVNSYPDLWAGNAVNVGGPLQFSDVQDALMDAAARGGAGDHCLYVSHPTWASLAGDMDALRALDSSYSKTRNEQGQESIGFRTGTGTVEVKPTLNMKNGSAVAFPKGAGFKRLGSADVGFEVPGVGEFYFKILSDEHGIEVRCYSDQFLWGTDLMSCVHFTGITN